MTVSRRQILGGAALLGAAGLIGLDRAHKPGNRPGVLVYDSSRPASRAFARMTPARRLIDLADAPEASWRALRALDATMPVGGFTSWNAYVAARGWLEEGGLRLVSEAVDRERGLIAWTMA